MKRISLLFLFAFCITVLVGYKPAEDDCYRLYEEILKTYQRYQGDRGYMKFRTYSVIDGVAGEKLDTELWKYDKKVKYTNLQITVFQDAGTQVMFVKDARSIVIRNVDSSAPLVQDFGSFNKDSLDKMTTAVNCKRKEGGISEYSMTLAKDYAAKSGIDRIVLDYNRKTSELLKGSYENFSAKRKDIFVYLDFRYDIAEPFPGKALDQVYAEGKKVKPAYSTYHIKDLR
jgi:hypothetical protein